MLALLFSFSLAVFLVSKKKKEIGVTQTNLGQGNVNQKIWQDVYWCSRFSLIILFLISIISIIILLSFESNQSSLTLTAEPTALLAKNVETTQTLTSLSLVENEEKIINLVKWLLFFGIG